MEDSTQSDRLKVAHELVGALETLVKLSEESHEQLVETRRSHAAQRGHVERALKDFVEGSLNSLHGLGNEIMNRPGSSLEGVHSRSVRTETAYLEVFRTLMCLYEWSDAREVADKVFTNVSNVRLSNLDPGPSSLPSGIPPIKVPDDSIVNPEERKKEYVKSVLERSMHFSSGFEPRLQFLEEQSPRNRELLVEALETAKLLVVA